jgi:uncharacterized protein YndB with AHSA1/START domain
MTSGAPLHYVFYIAVPSEKVWEGFVSPEMNRIIFGGADFEADLKPGGRLQWSGPDPKGNRIVYVGGEVLQSDAPKILQYTFQMGGSTHTSRVTIHLTTESEATKVDVTHDNFSPDDPHYTHTDDGWPRILSRLKTLLETGKTFKPH